MWSGKCGDRSEKNALNRTHSGNPVTTKYHYMLATKQHTVIARVDNGEVCTYQYKISKYVGSLPSLRIPLKKYPWRFFF